LGTGPVYPNMRVETLTISSRNSLARMANIPTLSVASSIRFDHSAPDSDNNRVAVASANLRKALDKDMLTLVYHPVIAVSDVEAKFHSVDVEPRDAKSCPYSPEEHRVLVNENPAGLLLDKWALEKAIKVISGVTKLNTPLQLLINVSAHTLQDAEFPAWLNA